MKRIFQILIFLSIIFLVIYLYRIDYLAFDIIKIDYFYLSISILFLWLGFFLSTFSWYKALKLHDINDVSLFSALYSHGIAVFAKYIPGKLWVIVSRAAYVSRKTSNLKTTSTISLKEQLIYILLGLTISAVPFLLLDFTTLFKASLILLILLLTVFLTSKTFHKIVIRLLESIFKKKIEIPVLNVRSSLRLSKFVLLYWAVWITAFYFFCKSVNINTQIIDSMAFPLSVSFGVLAIFAPGGIGVREGIIATFLIFTGWDKELAVSFSVLSRLWFLTGEFFIFLLSLSIKLIKKNNI